MFLIKWRVLSNKVIQIQNNYSHKAPKSEVIYRVSKVINSNIFFVINVINISNEPYSCK